MSAVSTTSRHSFTNASPQRNIIVELENETHIYFLLCAAIIYCTLQRAFSEGFQRIQSMATCRQHRRSAAKPCAWVHSTGGGAIRGHHLEDVAHGHRFCILQPCSSNSHSNCKQTCVLSSFCDQYSV